jgi:hypothetical protein
LDLFSGTDVGLCQQEIRSCINGSFRIIQERIDPFLEICNGLDDDCDGAIDENLDCENCKYFTISINDEPCKNCKLKCNFYHDQKYN